MIYEIIITLWTMYSCKSLQILTHLILLATIIGRYSYYLCFTVEETGTKNLSNFERVELAFKFSQPCSRFCTINGYISLIITEMQVSTAVLLLVTCNIDLDENTSTKCWWKKCLTVGGNVNWYLLCGDGIYQFISLSKMYIPLT